MPIYEPDLSYEDMEKATHKFKCAECGWDLIVAWSGEKNSYMLKCGKVLEHEGIVPRGRDLELLEIAHTLHGKELPMETTALMKLNPKQMLDRVNLARFPKDLTLPDRQLIAQVSIEYGLDPVFGELMIYQGRPYITIDARRRKAQETGNLDGINARPATKKEKEARGVPDEDYLFVAEVWVKGASHPFDGWGRVFTSETKGDPHLPIVKDPAAQAEKRAESQALRRAFHIPLPSFEEIIEGEFEEVPGKKEASQSNTNHLKDKTGTGRPPRSGTVTEPQKKKIWHDALSMGYQEAEIYTIIKEKWEVEGVDSLSIAQASTLIDMIARGEGLPGKETEKGEE